MPDRFETHPDHFACSPFHNACAYGSCHKKASARSAIHRSQRRLPFLTGYTRTRICLRPKVCSVSVSIGARIRSTQWRRLEKRKHWRSTALNFFSPATISAGFIALTKLVRYKAISIRRFPVPGAMIEGGFVTNPDILAGERQNPVGDTPQRYFEKSGDIRMSGVASGSKDFVIITMNGRVGSGSCPKSIYGQCEKGSLLTSSF